MYEKIVFAGICIYYLLLEYSKVKSNFIKAKIFHFIATVFIVVFHSNSFRDITKLLGHFESTYTETVYGLSKIDGIIYFVNHIIFLIFSFIIFFLGISLIYRSEKTRRILINFILLFIPLTTITVYMLAKKENMSNSVFFLLFGLIGSILIYGSISYLYRQKFMIDFFSIKKNSASIS